MTHEDENHRSPPQDPSLVARGFTWAVRRGLASILSLSIIVSASSVAYRTCPYFIFSPGAPPGGGHDREEGEGRGLVSTEETATLALGEPEVSVAS